MDIGIVDRLLVLYNGGNVFCPVPELQDILRLTGPRMPVPICMIHHSVGNSKLNSKVGVLYSPMFMLNWPTSLSSTLQHCLDAKHVLYYFFLLTPLVNTFRINHLVSALSLLPRYSVLALSKPESTTSNHLVEC